MLKINELKKAIRKANKETLKGLWKHMNYSEKEDVRILCERHNVKLNTENLQRILILQPQILKAVYKHAAFEEKEDLRVLAMR